MRFDLCHGTRSEKVKYAAEADSQAWRRRKKAGGAFSVEFPGEVDEKPIVALPSQSSNNWHMMNRYCCIARLAQCSPSLMSWRRPWTAGHDTSALACARRSSRAHPVYPSMTGFDRWRDATREEPGHGKVSRLFRHCTPSHILCSLLWVVLE